MADDPAGAADRAKTGPPGCPICGKPRRPEFKPFCSALCRDRDLLNWLEGRYAVPAVEMDDDQDPDRQDRE